MTGEERTSHWRNQVEKQADSGLSASAFCLDHDIKLSQFYRWRRKFRKSQSSGTPCGFLELVPSSNHGPSGVHIRIGDELRIELDRIFDPFTLRKAVETLSGSGPCLR